MRKYFTPVLLDFTKQTVLENERQIVQIHTVGNSLVATQVKPVSVHFSLKPVGYHACPGLSRSRPLLVLFRYV